MPNNVSDNRKTYQELFAAAAEEERDVRERTSNTSRRVKLEKGHSALVRFLPAEVGKRGLWYVRVAKHWFRKQPITCPVFTPEEWGGDKAGHCPVCSAVADLRESESDEIRDMGYQARVTLQYICWCIVLETEDSKGRIDTIKGDELLKPYEFQLYQTTFDTLSGWVQRASRKDGGSVFGVLDFEKGCDVLASRGKKGVTLDRQDPQSIFPLDDLFQSKIDKMMAQITHTRVNVPKERDLVSFAEKLKVAAEEIEDGYSDAGAGRRSRRSNNPVDDDADDDAADERPARRGRSAEDSDERDTERPRSRSRRDDDESASPSRDEDPGSERSSRRGRVERDEADEERPERTERRRRDDEGDFEPKRRETEDVKKDVRQDSAELEDRPVRSRRERTSREADDIRYDYDTADRGRDRKGDEGHSRRSEESLSSRSRDEDPVSRSRGDDSRDRKSDRKTVAESSVDSEEENVPEEKRDPAPPIKKSHDSLPDVDANAPAPKIVSPTESKLSAELKARLSKVTNREA